MIIPEIRLECLKISANLGVHNVRIRAEEFFEWIFKHIPHSEIDSEVIRKLNSLNHKIDIMGANTDKALQDLAEIKQTQIKIGSETATLLQKVTDLETAAENNKDTPPEVLAAIADVKAQAKAVDDLVPDAPAEGGGTTEGPQ